MTMIAFFVAIVEDARLPNRYRMLLSTVDVIFADVAQPDQARIVNLNASSFLRDGGHCIISIKVGLVDLPATVILMKSHVGFMYRQHGGACSCFHGRSREIERRWIQTY